MVAATPGPVSSEVVAAPAVASAVAEPEALLLAVRAVSAEEVAATVVVNSPAASANAGAGKSANTKSMEKRLLSAFLNMLLIPSNLW